MKTIAELEEKVNREIDRVQASLMDSPMSAANHLMRGMGFVQAYGEMMKWDVRYLEWRLEQKMIEVLKRQKL